MRALLVALAALVAVLSFSATASARAKTPIQWTECGTTFKGECASLDVPVDWSKPTGARFPLAIGRVKALDPANRIGVLFINPGGPGASGIDAYIIGRLIPDDSLLRKYFDIVSLDPRGVGRSNPVLCSADIVAETPATYPVKEAEYRALLDYNARMYADCRQHTGPVFDHVDTTSAVRDVDAIRAALGEDKISFYGSSYGTQVGQQYAELFPSRIRAMALDSNMDHSITDPYEYLRTTTDDLERSLVEFGAWCERTTSCALHGQDALAVWDDLFQKAHEGRLIDPATGKPIEAESLRFEMFRSMYRTVGWPALATRLAALAAPAPAPGDAASARTVALEENPYPAIWCADWKWKAPNGFADLSSWSKRLSLLAPHSKLSPFWSDITTCLGWPGRVPNAQHRLSISGAPPMLLVKGREDVATPKEWNYAAASQIPDSVLLEYDGIGHGAFRNSPCSRAYIEDYLVNRRLPPDGTHCPAVFPAGAASLLAPPDWGAPPSRPQH